MMNTQATQPVPTPVPEPVYRNSIPVVVLLVPVEEEGKPTGLLTVVRGIEPGRGKTALPGGYVEEEVWQDAALRELREETGIKLESPDVIQLESLVSVQEGKRLIIHCKTDPIRSDQIPADFSTDETLQLRVIHEPELMAFPSHTAAVRRFFEAQGSGTVESDPDTEAEEANTPLRQTHFTSGEKQRIEELAGEVSRQLERRFGAGGWAPVDRQETIDAIRVRFNWRREGSNWGWSDSSSCTVSDGKSSVSMDYPDLAPSKITARGEDPAGMLQRLLRKLGDGSTV